MARDDFRFLRGLPGSAEGSRISGTLWGPVSMGGFEVVVTGPGVESRAITGADGVFEFYGLPPGRYTLEPRLPDGLRIDMIWGDAPALSTNGGATQEFIVGPRP